MGADLTYVLRSLARRPGFAATIVGTLALGLGLVAGILSFADGYLFRPLPFASPEQLYRVRDPQARIWSHHWLFRRMAGAPLAGTLVLC